MIHCHFIPMDQSRHLFFNLLFIVPGYKGLIKTDNLGKYVTDNVHEYFPTAKPYSRS